MSLASIAALAAVGQLIEYRGRVEITEGRRPELAGEDEALAVRTFADPYAVTLEGSEGAEPLGWAGPDAVVVRLADGTYKLFPLGGDVPLDLGAATVILVVAPRTVRSLR